MNLHKVKGLEAPVVFLVDPAGESEHDGHVRAQGFPEFRLNFVGLCHDPVLLLWPSNGWGMRRVPSNTLLDSSILACCDAAFQDMEGR